MPRVGDATGRANSDGDGDRVAGPNAGVPALVEGAAEESGAAAGPCLDGRIITVTSCPTPVVEAGKASNV